METAIQKIEKLDEDTDKKAVQARVFQENEPAHFLQLFKGKMTILKGKANEYGKALFLELRYHCFIIGIRS